MKTKRIIAILIIALLMFGLTGCKFLPGKEEKNDESSEKKDSFEISFEEETYVTKNEKGEVVSENKRNVPTIKNEANQEIADKIQKSIREISDKNWKYIKESSDEYNYIQPTAGVSYMLSTATVADNYITFKAEQSGSFGGVGWDATEIYTYDLKSGELVDLKGFAKDEEKFVEFLSEEVKDFVKSSNMVYSSIELNSAIGTVLAEQGNYGIIDNKFEIVLPKYSIGTGADGVRIVEIEKDVINEYLKDNFQIK